MGSGCMVSRSTPVPSGRLQGAVSGSEVHVFPMSRPKSEIQLRNSIIPDTRPEVKCLVKLTEVDKKFLKEELHEDDESIDQIKRALKKTTFELDGKRISAEKVVGLIGRRKFLCGLDRSAFHWDAVQNTADGHEVYFDSRRFFREKSRRREAR